MPVKYPNLTNSTLAEALACVSPRPSPDTVLNTKLPMLSVKFAFATSHSESCFLNRTPIFTKPWRTREVLLYYFSLYIDVLGAIVMQDIPPNFIFNASTARSCAPINIKTVFPDMVSIIKVRRWWDRLIFLMGILCWQYGILILRRTPVYA